MNKPLLAMDETSSRRKTRKDVTQNFPMTVACSPACSTSFSTTFQAMFHMNRTQDRSFRSTRNDIINYITLFSDIQSKF